MFWLKHMLVLICSFAETAEALIVEKPATKIPPVPRSPIKINPARAEARPSPPLEQTPKPLPPSIKRTAPPSPPRKNIKKPAAPPATPTSATSTPATPTKQSQSSMPPSFQPKQLSQTHKAPLPLQSSHAAPTPPPPPSTILSSTHIMSSSLPLDQPLVSDSQGLLRLLLIKHKDIVLNAILEEMSFETASRIIQQVAAQEQTLQNEDTSTTNMSKDAPSTKSSARPSDTTTLLQQTPTLDTTPPALAAAAYVLESLFTAFEATINKSALSSDLIDTATALDLLKTTDTAGNPHNSSLTSPVNILQQSPQQLN